MSDSTIGNEIKRMDIKLFRETGYLQELNRQFLHPLGLALEVIVAEDGSERLGGIWDYRDDPEGVLYGGNLERLAEKAKRAIKLLQDSKAKTRMKRLGYVIQPVHDLEPE